MPRTTSRVRSAERREPTPGVTKGKMQVRVVTLAALVVVLFAVLGIRLWHLQIITGDDYSLMSQDTQTREISIPAKRGAIYDRDGEVLAKSAPGLNVTAVPNAISRGKVEELAGILGSNAGDVLERYDNAVERGDVYSPILVKENAAPADVTYVSERAGRGGKFPGVSVNEDWVRSYQEETLASHVLGYTAPITDEMLGQKLFDGLSADAVVGMSGVERSYEEVLRGKAGSKKYKVDALGRSVTLRNADGSRADGRPEVSPMLGEATDVTPAEPGKNLALTIDSELQKFVGEEIEEAMVRARNHEKDYAGTGGAAVVLDPENGQILAMASRPAYDPELFVGGISEEETGTYERLTSESSRSPFTDRAISGRYPPASAFKMFTGLAGFVNGVLAPQTTVTDDGSCWRPTGVDTGCWQSWRETLGTGTIHGTQNYAEAIADSNDKFFYQVADWLWQKAEDADLLPEFYRKFGFGSETGVDLPGENAGLVPDSEWERKTGSTPQEKLWTVGNWVNMSIGQGALQATPLQLARSYAAIQNGGKLVIPHVGLEVRDQSGEVVREINPEPAARLDLHEVGRRETLQGLRMVTGPRGTAERVFADTPLSVLGKTGSGEVTGKDPVAWFAGWAENQGDPVVVVVMVEQGGSGLAVAAPAVRDILEFHHGVEESAGDGNETEPAQTTGAGTE